MKIFLKYTLVFIALFSLNACFRTRSYDFIIRNNTAYRIDDMAFSQNNYTIPPFGSTEKFTLYLKKNKIAFTNPQFGAYVKSYSNDTTYYIHSTGVSVVISGLSSTKITYVDIELNPKSKNEKDRFQLNFSN
jgi:hypothetical protein